NRLDVVNRLWTQTIVQFNALRQQSLLTPFGIGKAERRDLVLALAVIIGIVLAIATAGVLRVGRRREGDLLDAGWGELQRRVGHRGIASRSDEGPCDFLARVRMRVGQGEAGARIGELVERYVQLRYACVEAPAQAVRDFTRAVRDLRLPRRG